MQVTAERDALCAAAKKAALAAAPKSTIPNLRYIQLQGDEKAQELRVMATDLTTYIVARIRNVQVVKPGSVQLPAAVAAGLFEELAGNTVEITGNGKLVTVSSDRASFTFSVDSTPFPSLPCGFPADTIQVTGLSSLIRQSSYAAAVTDENGKANLTGVELSFSSESSYATATDGYRSIIAEKEACANGQQKLLIPRDSLLLLSKLTGSTDRFFCGVSGKYAVFFNEDVLFFTRLLDGAMVDIPTLYSRIRRCSHAKAETSALKEAVECAVAGLTADDDPCIDLTVEDGAVTVSSLSRASRFRTKIPAGETEPMPADGYHYNPSLLLDFLRHASGPLEMTFDSSGYLLLAAGKNRYAMGARRPARLREPEKPKATKTKKPRNAKAA